jgi:ferric-dicitrate binding protein FerR (iron transport regulator)
MTDCLSLRERAFAPGADPAHDPVWAEHLQQCAECRVAQRGLPAVERALDEIGRLPVAVPDFAAIADAAAGAARSQRRRRVMRRSAPFFYTGLGAAALAAGIVAVVLIGKSGAPSPKLLVPGAELQANSEAKSARLSNGVRIRLDAGTLKLAAAGKDNQALVLASGRVLLDVPKLPPGSTVSVRTPDAEVRVHGTRFQVIRTNQETQVHVIEGVVEVRPEGIGRPSQTLRAGESATVGSAEAYREGLRRSTLAALDHGEFSAAEAQIGQLLGAGADAAQQAEAQALLAWSLSARGQRANAIARYRQALTLLPQGQRPLWAENACAELAILVEQQAPKDAAVTWSECLRRFPNGVHAASARSRVHSSR